MVNNVISFEGSKATVRLNHNFYCPETISKAVSAFSDCCNINCEEKKDNSFVFLESKSEIEAITYEFCNYVLGLMKGRLVRLAHYDTKNEE